MSNAFEYCDQHHISCKGCITNGVNNAIASLKQLKCFDQSNCQGILYDSYEHFGCGCTLYGEPSNISMLNYDRNMQVINVNQQIRKFAKTQRVEEHFNQKRLDQEHLAFMEQRHLELKHLKQKYLVFMEQKHLELKHLEQKRLAFMEQRRLKLIELESIEKTHEKIVSEHADMIALLQSHGIYIT